MNSCVLDMHGVHDKNTILNWQIFTYILDKFSRISLRFLVVLLDSHVTRQLVLGNNGWILNQLKSIVNESTLFFIDQAKLIS